MPSDTHSPARAGHLIEAPRTLSPTARRIGVGALIVAAMLLWLHMLGRPAACPCGTISLWGGDVPQEDSQQFADWYSLLHGTFGMGLFLLLRRVQPGWPIGKAALAALASSAAWEAIENLPVVIGWFGAVGDGPAYAGDSMFNALGDTFFVMLGFQLASRLSAGKLMLAVVAAEVTVGLAAHDGLILGSLRLVQGMQA